MHMYTQHPIKSRLCRFSYLPQFPPFSDLPLIFFFCASGDAQQECRPVFYARNAAGCGASGSRVTRRTRHSLFYLWHRIRRLGHVHEKLGMYAYMYMLAYVYVYVYLHTYVMCVFIYRGRNRSRSRWMWCLGLGLTFRISGNS